MFIEYHPRALIFACQFRKTIKVCRSSINLDIVIILVVLALKICGKLLKRQKRKCFGRGQVLEISIAQTLLGNLISNSGLIVRLLSSYNIVLFIKIQLCDIVEILGLRQKAHKIISRTLDGMIKLFLEHEKLLF